MAEFESSRLTVDRCSAIWLTVGEAWVFLATFTPCQWAGPGYSLSTFTPCHTGPHGPTVITLQVFAAAGSS